MQMSMAQPFYHFLSDISPKDLITRTRPLCLSLYMPVSHPIRKSDKNRLELKNLTNELRRQLSDAPYDKIGEKEALSHFDTFDWNELGEKPLQGIAFFGTPQQLDVVSSEIPFLPFSAVAEHAIVTPLISAEFLQRSFFYLKLALADTALFSVDGSQINRIELEGVPHSFDNFMEQYDLEKSSQLRTHHEGSGVRELFHAHGSAHSTDIYKDQFISLWAGASALWNRVGSQQLVLAGVKEATSLFLKKQTKRANDSFIIHDSLDGIEPDKVLLQLKELVREHNRVKMSERVSALLEQSSSPHKPACEERRLLLEYSRDGRIQVLLIKDDVWKLFYKDPHHFYDLERIITGTLLAGGEVLPVPADWSHPDEGYLALLRY